jgi:hypothetical protein
MQSPLLEYYKSKYGKSSSKKAIPVDPTGMWYQEGDIVVPGDEITMNGPNGEPDFFEKNGKKEDIFGVGIPSGKMIVMEPGKNYSFPGDLAVLESKKFPSFMMGGIPGVNGTVVGNTMMPTSTNKKRTKKYQVAGTVANPSNNKIASELVPRFKVNNPLADEFVPPSLISLLGIDKKQGSLDLQLSKSGKVGNINLASTISPLNIGQQDKKSFVSPTSVKAGLNLGALGKVGYNTELGKNTNLKEIVDPSNFSYSNRFRNKNISGAVTINPKQTSSISLNKNSGVVNYGASAEYGPKGLQSIGANLNADDFLDFSYSRDKAEEGYSSTFNASLNAGRPLSLNFSSNRNPEGDVSRTIGGKVKLKNTSASLSKNIGQGSGTYNASVSQKMGPLTLTAKGTATKEKVQDYNIGANLTLFGPTKTKSNRPSLNITADYGKKTDETGNLGKAKFTPGISYKYAFKKGGQHGGLDRWFAEKWVDVKTGKACGRQEGESRAGYPACRPSKRISSKTPKTSSEMSSQEKAKFKASKTSSQRIPYNHKRKK